MNRPPATSLAPHRARARRTQLRSWRCLALTVPGDEPGLLGPIRRVVTANLRSWGVGAERAFDVQVCVSELVANVLRYTEGDARLVLKMRARALLVEVSDLSPDSLQRREMDESGQCESGKGLRIVAALASRVEVQIRPGIGKTVAAIFEDA